MPKLAQKRINFITLLHQAFFASTGYRAFHYISVAEAVNLYNTYLDSNEDMDLFINQYVRSVK